MEILVGRTFSLITLDRYFKACLREYTCRGRGRTAILSFYGKGTTISPCPHVAGIHMACVKFVLADSADPDGAGAQWRGPQQGAERPHAGPPGVQRPTPHPTLHGAHP